MDPPPPPYTSLFCHVMFDMDSSLIIVKLGGAALTDKRTPHTLLPSLARTCEVVASSAPSRVLRIVHGAGSFGHFEARAGGLRAQQPGAAPAAVPPAAVSATRAALGRLTLRVLAGLGVDGAAPVAISVFPRDAPGALEADMDAAAAAGLLPVTHGDVALSGGGAAVVGGDELAVRLTAHALTRRAGATPPSPPPPPPRLVFVTGARRSESVV